MAFVIAEPCIGTKDTACVDACPVDCIHPKKDTREIRGRRDDIYRSGGVHRLRRVRPRLPRFGDLRARRSAGEVEGVHRAQRQVLRSLAFFSNKKGTPCGCAFSLLRVIHISCSIFSISTSGGSPLVINKLASSSAWGGSVKYAKKKMMGMSAKLVCSRPICAFRWPRGFQKIRNRGHVSGHASVTPTIGLDVLVGFRES